MEEAPDIGDADQTDQTEAELALRAKARLWSRQVRRAGWGLGLAGVAIGAGLYAVLH